MGITVGHSVIGESRGSKKLTHPTVAEASADVGVLVGDTPLRGEQAEVLPLFLSSSWGVLQKKQGENLENKPVGNTYAIMW